LYGIGGSSQIGLSSAALTCGNLTLTSDFAPFAFRHSTPDPELLARDNREFQTLGANRTFATDLLCRACRGTTLWEEEIGIGTATVGKVLPSHVDATDTQGFYEVWKHVNSRDLVITMM
jgi:hypothetical protein